MTRFGEALVKRGGLTLCFMTISVVLRLAPAALAEGRLAGEAELADTGQRRLVASAEELLAFVAAHQAGSSRHGPSAGSKLEGGADA